MTEEDVVVAVLLPVRETSCAIAARRAGSKVARPQFREFQAVFPANHSRLAGKLAELRRICREVIGAGAFGHGVANFEMEHDSRRGKCLLNHRQRIVTVGVRRGVQILLGGIARAVG